MNRDQWESIALLIDNCWRGEFDDTMSSSYFTMLGRFDHEEVMTALHACVETGRPFIPTVPEIVAEIRRQQEPELPSWTEVWDQMRFVLSRCRNEDDAVTLLGENCGPVAAAFLRTEGFERLQHEPLLDPDYGPLRVKELRLRWLEFAERSAERIKQGRAIEAHARTAPGLQQMTAAGLIAKVSEAGETM